jgi:hypothetical protein
MGVVDVPEEPAFLQVVRNHHEQHAVGSERPVGLRHELPGRVDTGHVLQHLVGVKDVATGVVRGDRWRPGERDLQTQSAQLGGQYLARLDAAVAPPVCDGSEGQRTVPGTNLEQVSWWLGGPRQEGES